MVNVDKIYNLLDRKNFKFEKIEDGVKLETYWDAFNVVMTISSCSIAVVLDQNDNVVYFSDPEHDNFY